MMHMRISIDEARPAEPARYGPRRVNPVALGLVVAGHAVLIGLALAYRFTIADEYREPPLVVHDVDLTPPPPPPEQPEPTPPQRAVYAPRPPLVLQLPQQPAVTTTQELPVEPAAVETAPEVAPAPAPAAPQPVVAGDLSASMIHAPPPRYPIESRRKREQGTVMLAVLLATDGTVADIRVARSSGHARLDAAAVNAVGKWRWSPTIRNGVAAQVRGTVEIPFILTAPAERMRDS